MVWLLIAWVVSLALLETLHGGELRLRDATIESLHRDIARMKGGTR